jgi:transcriptional regulator with XRE-family HTH domain
VKNPLGVKEFGIHLRRLREERNLSQQELADLSDVAKKTIQRIENAKYSATIDIIISISKGMGLPMNKLSDFIPPKEKKKP